MMGQHDRSEAFFYYIRLEWPPARSLFQLGQAGFGTALAELAAQLRRYFVLTARLARGVAPRLRERRAVIQSSSFGVPDFTDNPWERPVPPTTRGSTI